VIGEMRAHRHLINQGNQMSALTRKEPSQVKGRSTAGGIPCSVRAGETVFGMMNITFGGNELANFESTISVNGQIQQTSTSNLSGNEYLVYTF
jgi:hypothetical protein